jgi:hypothetical protein
MKSAQVNAAGQRSEYANEPEFMRLTKMGLELRNNLASRHNEAHEKIFTRVYGPGGEQRFWEAMCATPVKVSHAVRIFACLLAPEEVDFERQSFLVKAAMREAANLAIACFAGDPTPLKATPNAWQIDERHFLKIDVRKFGGWLAGVPTLSHLLPKSLEVFLQTSSAVGSAGRGAGNQKGKGGRPPKYDWPRIEAQLAAKLYEDGIPAKGEQAALEEYCATLFDTEKCPTESVIREHVTAAVQRELQERARTQAGKR